MQSLNNRIVGFFSPSGILLVILALFMVIFAASCTQNAWRQGDESHSQTQQAEALATARLIQTQQWLHAKALEASQTSEASTSRQATQTAQAAGGQTATALAPPSSTPTLTPDPKQPPPCTQVGQTWTSPVDSMTLVCVPEGAFSMGSEDGDDDEKPLHEVTLDAFWIDRTEVTNATFAAFVEATGYQTEAEDQGWGYVWTNSDWEQVEGADWQHPQGPGSSLDELSDHPVVQVSWNDAKAYCEWAERRLPTEAEWEKAARGTDGRTYPWGNEQPDGNLVNFADINLDVGWAYRSTDDGYQFTAPVGSYADGASPYGALDMAGNVMEWAADWYAEDHYVSQEIWLNPQGPASGKYRVLRGGSWYYYGKLLRSSSRSRIDPDVRSDNGGFRCAHSAQPEPNENATPTPEIDQTSTIKLGPNNPPPCTQVGQTWTSPVDGMTLVCVPAGAFSMGSEDGDDDEKPLHEVTLHAFWIDHTEVTNTKYAQCVEAGVCSQPSSKKSYTRDDYYDNPDYADFPVIYVDWNQAQAYCEWAERRLPTEAEWEKAARGMDERTYPWGEGIDCNFANYGGGSGCVGDTTAVGSYADGASPYGALDMAGNVWEWVNSLYKPYPYNPNDGREDKNDTGGRVLRGGSWDTEGGALRSSNRFGGVPDLRIVDLGFRCARSE